MPDSPFSGPADFTLGVLARCPTSGALGAAVASSTVAAASRCFLVDGALGAVLVMAFPNVHLGALAIKLLRDTLEAEEIFALLRQHDRHFAYRQVAILPAGGEGRAFSGERTPIWSGAMADGDRAVLANGLADGAALVAAERALDSGDSLERRLVAALKAGAACLRPEAEVRSAGLYVGVPDGPRRADLRVDMAHGVAGGAADNAIGQLCAAVETYEPLISYYQALPDDPDIGSWRDWSARAEAGRA